MKVIQAENLGKKYRLGVINRGMLYKDLQSWWARVRGKEDPHASIMESLKTGQQGEEFWAFRDVSFSVEPGEIVGVVGRNGAGKSTLLKVLSQITAPSEGVIRIKGKVASLLEVGTGFHGELTGRENIFLNGAILGMTRSDVRARFDSIVEFAEVAKFIDTPVKRYSSGMYVRLAFSVAAHLQPDILVVDEVLAVGDAAFRQKCLAKMDDVARREGRAVLFVSHNMEALRSLCTRGILLHWGRMVCDEPIGKTLERYLSVDGSTAESAFGSDRGGTGAMRMTRLDIQSPNGMPLDAVPTGAPVRMVLDYTNHSLPEGAEFTVGLGLFSATSDLLNNYSHYDGTAFHAQAKGGRIIIDWSSVDLVPGRYYLGFVVFSRHDGHSGQLLDKSGSIVLEVTPGDFYNTGKKFQGGSGFFLTRQKWQHVPLP
ncbi:MAG: hypothetical protein Fur0032_01670 [Terrimicrobiaceae bacterium]